MRSRMLALQLALAAGPLIGWGVTDVVGYAGSVARVGLVVAAIATTLMVARQRARVDPFAVGTETSSLTSRTALALGIAAVPVLLAILAWADRHDTLVTADRSAIRAAGLLMYACGETVRIMALRTLGPQYSAYVTLQPDHALVRTGVYALVRHPIYLAQILAMPGAALVFRSVFAVPLLVLSVLFASKRIAREEALLGSTFPDFDQYCRRTWRLVPFVY